MGDPEETDGIVSPPLVLGIETSCDETSAALVMGAERILGHVILSQDIHAIYGGVVPELAARAHLLGLEEVVDEALAILREHPETAEAALIGTVVESHPGMVLLNTGVGGTRVVDTLPGDQLPRIC